MAFKGKPSKSFESRFALVFQGEMAFCFAIKVWIQNLAGIVPAHKIFFVLAAGGSMKYFALPLFALLFLSGCANPLNEATSNRYSRICSEAEQNGDFLTAEQACYRALVNVDWGNLGPEYKSQKLYNLGRIKRKVGKYGEAEDLLKQSLEIEETLTGPTSQKIGRRLAELALTYGEKEQFTQGTPYVKRVNTMIDLFQGQELQTIGALNYFYGEELAKTEDTVTAKEFSQQAKNLGFSLN